MNWIELLSYIAIALVGYTYVVFPLITLVRAKLVRRPWKIGTGTPPLSIVIVCFNEADHILEKLGNVISCDYPADQLEIIVASDGSTDGTDDIVRSVEDPRIRLFSFPRRGKIAALNEAVEKSTGEILVFTDANSLLGNDALKKLTRHFSDVGIGCVAGNQVYIKADQVAATAEGEQTYWNFDRRMKQAQTSAGNAISATGALYAIRRSIFENVPDGVTDDFAISTNAVRQGFRLIYENEAIAMEKTAGNSGVEFRRKVRIMTRGLRGLYLSVDLFNPFRYGFYSLQILSHKFLRRVCVVPMLVLLGLSPWLMQSNLFLQTVAVGLWGLLGVFVLSLVLYKSAVGKFKPFRLLLFFGMANLAALVAIKNVILGKKIDKWQPTGTS